MSIKINSNELQKIIETTPPVHNIMLTGKYGIGRLFSYISHNK